MAKTQAKYVDGFVFVVKKEKLAAYKKMAKEGSKVWMKHGALSYKECQIQDANPMKQKYTFSTMTKAKPGETVWFSYIEYKSKKHRDQVNAKVMKEMSETYSDADMTNMPFDVKRMVNAGFQVMVSN